MVGFGCPTALSILRVTFGFPAKGEFEDGGELKTAFSIKYSLPFESINVPLSNSLVKALSVKNPDLEALSASVH